MRCYMKKQRGCLQSYVVRVSKCVQHSCATLLEILIPKKCMCRLNPRAHEAMAGRGYKAIHQYIFVGKSYTSQKKKNTFRKSVFKSVCFWKPGNLKPNPTQTQSLYCGFCFSGRRPPIDSGHAVALTDFLDFPLVLKQLQPMLLFFAGGTDKSHQTWVLLSTSAHKGHARCVKQVPQTSISFMLSPGSVALDHFPHTTWSIKPKYH